MADTDGRGVGILVFSYLSLWFSIVARFVSLLFMMVSTVFLIYLNWII